MTFQIDSNIPIPPRYRNGINASFPFKEMAVGDSFWVDGETSKRARAAASTFSKATGHKYTTRADGDGVRVWRSH